MGLLRTQVTRRFKTLALLSDLALVGGAAARIVQRRNGAATREASVTELALAGGAAWRLVRRFGRRRRNRTVAVVDAVG